MSTREALNIPVDVTNPGQFFACCGLLELAHRLDHRAVGWFADAIFHIAGAPKDLLNQFLDCPAQPLADSDAILQGTKESEQGEEKTVPIQFGAPFNLRLDWWRDKAAERAKLKTWSAGQKVTDLFNGKSTTKSSKKGDRTAYAPGMRDHLRTSMLANPTDWLRATMPIDSPRSFSYDSRLSRNNALDLGHFAGNTMAFSPAVDVLIMVGLQRFRPLVIETWNRNLYCTWNEPVPVVIAAIVAFGAIPQLVDAYFEFPIKPRDAQGRYKLFGHAQPVRSPDA